MVGGSPENDFTILRLSEGLYRSFGLKRVYYSAYIPVADNPLLPARATKPPMLREHRLYQADWLLRFYGFRAEEVLTPEQPDLDVALDPKTGWALGHPDFFPVDVNRASYEEILRVPGIGVRSAQRILTARRGHLLDGDDLGKLGVVMKRARFFVACKSPAFPAFPAGGDLRRLLSSPPRGKEDSRQLRLEF
jgi:predicted DNA-binding helix-hairpin-helix protein